MSEWTYDDGSPFVIPYVGEPGTRCPMCDRRFNKPRRKESPDARKVSAGLLPEDRAQALEEFLDNLQAYVNADGESYPRGTLLEWMAVFVGQRREEFKYDLWHAEGAPKEEGAS